MNYLVDTDIMIFWLNNKYESVKTKFYEIPDNQLFVSSITIAELYYGAYNSSKINENLELLDELILELNILYFDEGCGKIFGETKANLKKKGELINDSDLFIASIALNNKLCLVTNNEKHFRRIEGLDIENWVEFESTPKSSAKKEIINEEQV